MIITKQIAKELGCYESVEIEGVTYMFDPYKEDYSIDGSVSYFHALKIGADVDVDDIDDVLLTQIGMLVFQPLNGYRIEMMKIIGNGQ